MKVTSLKDLERYLYLSVIVPLKSLGVETETQSPLKNSNGNSWYLWLQLTPVVMRGRRNYQRRQAEHNRDWQVWMNNGTSEYLVADYSIRTHWVKIYEKPFQDTGSMLIYGKLHKLFSENKPFSKVITMLEPRASTTPRRFSNPLAEPSDMTVGVPEESPVHLYRLNSYENFEGADDL